VLLPDECLLLLFISLSTQSGNFRIHPRILVSRVGKGGTEGVYGKISIIRRFLLMGLHTKLFTSLCLIYSFKKSRNEIYVFV
jgi:hypothetical protein